jgi:hypothetical protein
MYSRKAKCNGVGDPGLFQTLADVLFGTKSLQKPIEIGSKVARV